MTNVSAEELSREEKAKRALEIIKMMTEGGREMDEEAANVIKQYLDTNG